MSKIKFEEFFAIFQERVNKCLSSPQFHKYTYQDGISCLCISHDNSHVFMGAIDGSLGTFNLSTKELEVLYKISEVEAEITAITVTKDDKYVIFGVSNGSIGVFDWVEKQMRHLYQDVHQDAISSLALTKDYEYIISGCRDGSVGIFDMGMEMRTAIIQEAHGDVINIVKLCSNDKYIVTASDDKSIRIFDFQKRQLLYTIQEAHQSGVTSLVITNDAKYILSASNNSDKSLKIFDFRTRELVHTFLDRDSSSVTALTVTDDDKYIISGCLDRSIRIYDLQKRHFLYCFENLHEDPITTLAITSSKHFIVSACYDGSIHALDLQSKDLVHSYRPHEGKVTSLVTTHDKKRIISASRDCSIEIFNIKTQDTVWKILKAHKAAITGLALTNDDEILISVSRDKSIKFFNINTFEEIHCIRDAHADPITTLAITSNNRQIVTAAEDLTIKIFDFMTKNCVHTFENAQGYPGSSIAISRDSKYIINVSIDRSLYIFDIEKKTKFQSYENKGILTSLLLIPEIPLSLSQDSQTILFQMDQSSIGVYNLERREMFGKLENCIDGTLTALTMTSKYDYIIAGSTKGDISILDLSDGKKVYMFEKAHKTKITNIILAEHDKFIVSSDVEGTINIFTNPLSTNEILVLDISINTKASIFDLMILNRFIFEESFPAKIEIMKKYPDLQVYPYRWNFFHLISKFYSRRDLIISAIQLQLPLLIDSYNHTPLHYLLNKREIDFGMINGLLENYSELILRHPNRDKIVQSLTSDLSSLLRMNTSEVAYFLRIGVGKPLTYRNEDIPDFGKLKNNADSKFLVSKYQTFSPEVRSELLHPEVEEEEEEEEEQENTKVDTKPVISISVLKFYLNYHPYSKDMLHIIQALKRVSNEDIFKSQTASILVQYLWTENRIIHYVLTFIFSVLMIVLSVYSASENKNLALEIIILSLSVLYFSYEMFQLHFTPFKIYLTQIWNVFNVIFTAILSVTIILQWVELPIFTMNVLLSVSLFFGYLKWISFFRVIDQTRRLIRVILEILMAMRSFILILVFLVFGFSLIFNQFDRETTFGGHLLSIYTMIYAQSDPSEFSTPQVFYYVIFTIILAVVLLNMLVAIMTDTYDKSLDKSVLAEGREKVSLILEATVLMRAFKKICNKRRKLKKQLKETKRKLEKQLIRHTDSLFEKQALQETDQTEKSTKRGFLFYVRKVEKDFDYASNLFEWNQGVKIRRNIGGPSALVDENDLSEFAILRAQNSELRAIVENQDSKIKGLEKEVKSGFDDLEKKFKEKMETILTTIMEDSQAPTVSDLQAKYVTKRTASKKITQKDVTG